MAALVAPLIARYTVNGTYAGRPVANVMDIRIDNAVSADRAQLVPDMASVFLQAWTDHIIENLVDNYTAQSVSWVDLNSTSGVVGSTTTGLTTNLPQNGAQVGDAMPGNVAVRVNKNIAAARGQRQGRMYLPGMTETQTTDGAPNNPSAAYITAFNADLVTFIADLNVTFVSPSPAATTIPVVVHTQNQAAAGQPPDIVFDGYSEITSMTVDATLGSQRRRLRG